MKKEDVKTGYLLFPAIPFNTRFLIIAACFIGGLFIQITVGWIWQGIVLLLAGSLLGVHRKLTTEVRYTGIGSPDWERVTAAEWQRMKELKAKSDRWRSDISNVLSGKGILFVSVIIVCVFVMFITLIEIDENDDALILMFLGDSLAIFLPLLLTGSIVAWMPPGITVKMAALDNVYRHLRTAEEKGEIEVTPMFAMAQATRENKGKQLPIDVKLMVRFPGSPETFFGVQVQCSINNVGSTPYPYLYAVVLFDPKYPLSRANLPRPKGKDLDFEPSQSAEAIILVVRQHTTKTSGYHTPPAKQVEVVESAIDLARRCLEH